MKRITLIESRNGYLVIDGEATTLELPGQLAKRTWSYNSLDAAIARIRKVLRGWKQEAAKQAEGGE